MYGDKCMNSHSHAAESVELPFDCKSLANYILDWADMHLHPISPMKLQKLLYFCHADFLVQKNLRLIKQNFEAWDHGPVIPSIYLEFKGAGSNPIIHRARTFDPLSGDRKTAQYNLPDQIATELHQKLAYYVEYSAMELSDWSHEPNGPWRKARASFANGLNMDRRIPDQLISEHHRSVSLEV